MLRVFAAIGITSTVLILLGVTGVGNPTETFSSVQIDTSAELRAILTDETGTGAACFATAPTFTTSWQLGAAGVICADDGDGAIECTGAGDGFDECWSTNYDDTSNTIVYGNCAVTTSVATVNFAGVAVQEAGIGLLNADEIDASSELIAILDDETGTGALVFGTAPTLAGLDMSSDNLRLNGVQLDCDADDNSQMYCTDNVFIWDTNGTERMRLNAATDLQVRLPIQNPAANLSLNDNTDVTGTITGTSTITSSGTADLGWSVVDGTDNTACTSQCTSAAVFGFHLVAGVYTTMVGPADATADICVCAGGS